jgi:V8-like Glu-specific endopeptidase
MSQFPAQRIFLAATVVALSLGWSSSAAATTTPAGQNVHVERSTPAQVFAYWTKARMAQARSADLSGAARRPVLPGGWATSLSDALTYVGSERAPAHVTTTSASGPSDESNQGAFQIYSAGFTHYKVVGRLYYTEPNGKPYTCSATVVSRDVIVTAGHCAYTATENPTGWNSLQMFVPDKYGSSTPYGSWAITTKATWPRWRQSAWWPHDYAFLKIAPDASGRYIGDVTGWASMVINATSIGDIWGIGYPRTGFFRTWDGEYGYYCYSPYSDFSTIVDSDGVAGYDIGYGCYMTGGASGGPMFTQNNGSWINVLSVNSHCWPAGCTEEGQNVWSRNLWGPYFDDNTLALYNIVENS